MRSAQPGAAAPHHQRRSRAPQLRRCRAWRFSRARTRCPMSARSRPGRACCAGWRSCRDVAPLFLVSGGSSSLVEVLVPGVSFADLERLTDAGIASGIDIGELNARRVRYSLIKGGRLTARLPGRPRARSLFPMSRATIPGSSGRACSGPPRRVSIASSAPWSLPSTTRWPLSRAAAQGWRLSRPCGASTAMHAAGRAVCA